MHQQSDNEQGKAESGCCSSAGNAAQIYWVRARSGERGARKEERSEDLRLETGGNKETERTERKIQSWLNYIFNQPFLNDLSDEMFSCIIFASTPVIPTSLTPFWHKFLVTPETFFSFSGASFWWCLFCCAVVSFFSPWCQTVVAALVFVLVL